MDFITCTVREQFEFQDKDDQSKFYMVEWILQHAQAQKYLTDDFKVWSVNIYQGKKIYVERRRVDNWQLDGIWDLRSGGLMVYDKPNPSDSVTFLKQWLKRETERSP